MNEVEVICGCCSLRSKTGDPRYMRAWPECCGQPMTKYDPRKTQTAKASDIATQVVHAPAFENAVLEAKPLIYNGSAFVDGVMIRANCRYGLSWWQDQLWAWEEHIAKAPDPTRWGDSLLKWLRGVGEACPMELEARFSVLIKKCCNILDPPKNPNGDGYLVPKEYWPMVERLLAMAYRGQTPVSRIPSDCSEEEVNAIANENLAHG